MIIKLNAWLLAEIQFLSTVFFFFFQKNVKIREPVVLEKENGKIIEYGVKLNTEVQWLEGLAFYEQRRVF